MHSDIDECIQGKVVANIQQVTTAPHAARNRMHSQADKQGK
jgi:hypothetical protein